MKGKTIGILLMMAAAAVVVCGKFFRRVGGRTLYASYRR